METGNRHIIDRYADLKVEVDALTKRLDAMRQDILATFGTGEHKGDEASITITQATQTRLDTETLKGYVSADTLAACQKTITFPKLTVSAIRRAVK